MPWKLEVIKYEVKEIQIKIRLVKFSPGEEYQESFSLDGYSYHPRSWH